MAKVGQKSINYSLILHKQVPLGAPPAHAAGKHEWDSSPTPFYSNQNKIESNLQLKWNQIDPKWTHSCLILMHRSNPRKPSTSKWRVVLDLAAGKAVDTTRRSSIHRRWSPIRQQDHWLTATAGLVPHAQQQQRSGRVEMEETGSAPSQTTLLWLNGRSHVDPITIKQAHIRFGADPAAFY